MEDFRTWSGCRVQGGAFREGGLAMLMPEICTFRTCCGILYIYTCAVDIYIYICIHDDICVRVTAKCFCLGARNFSR